MADSSQITLHRKGIIQGLSSYFDAQNDQKLTALVASATGLSGYQKVKVLAASSRWGKTFCLSSRTPPENFYNDLGGDSQHVEHVAVDFLGEPSQTAQVLDKIQHVDHIFYFLYMQPAFDDDALDLWANAKAQRLSRHLSRIPASLWTAASTMPKKTRSLFIAIPSMPAGM